VKTLVRSLNPNQDISLSEAARQKNKKKNEKAENYFKKSQQKNKSRISS